MAAGAEVDEVYLDVIAPAMGHADSRMVERVYGRLSPTDLAARLAAQLGVPAPQLPRTQSDSVEAVEGSEAPTAENPREFVPRPGIEPGTRGFSGLRESPGSYEVRLVLPRTTPRR